MRTATLTVLLFVASGYAATAQRLTFLPQAGLENFRTSIRYNDLSTLHPLCGLVSPHLGLRMDYKFMKGHGLFVGASTTRSIVNFRFTDPEAGMNTYEADAGKLRVRFEGGYQFTTKPLFFKKSNFKSKSSRVEPKSSKAGERQCGRYGGSSYRCGKSSEKSIAARSKSRGWSVRIQPSLGLAMVPALKQDAIAPENNQGTFLYKAGNWNTALTAGTGFEFGRNRQRLFTISVNYLKGLGNLETRSITSVSGIKTTTTHLKSNTSAWSVTAGIPISLDKKKSIARHNTMEKSYKKEGGCGQYKMRYKKVI